MTILHDSCCKCQAETKGDAQEYLQGRKGLWWLSDKQGGLRGISMGTTTEGSKAKWRGEIFQRKKWCTCVPSKEVFGQFKDLQLV